MSNADRGHNLAPNPGQAEDFASKTTKPLHRQRPQNTIQQVLNDKSLFQNLRIGKTTHTAVKIPIKMNDDRTSAEVMIEASIPDRTSTVQTRAKPVDLRRLVRHLLL